VHAGADLLLSELKQDITAPPNIEKIVEQLEDIFQASESAVNFLNDLLNYEHIDAG